MYDASLSNRSYALNVPLVMRRVVMKYSLRWRNRDVFIFELVVGFHGKISRPRRNSTLQRQKNMPKSPFSNCYIILRYKFLIRSNLSVSAFLIYSDSARVWKKHNFFELFRSQLEISAENLLCFLRNIINLNWSYEK